jgi:L-alanine-DL-glutamate epimerase-like enolase superfamily enzyme
VIYVNHTFTSHLALSASIQPFAGLKVHRICEYPLESKPVALAITKNRIERDAEGEIRAPDAPGLGMTVDPALFKPYLQDVEIKVAGKVLYRTPPV